MLLRILRVLGDASIVIVCSIVLEFVAVWIESLTGLQVAYEIVEHLIGYCFFAIGFLIVSLRTPRNHWLHLAWVFLTICLGAFALLIFHGGFELGTLLAALFIAFHLAIPAAIAGGIATLIKRRKSP